MKIYKGNRHRKHVPRDLSGSVCATDWGLSWCTLATYGSPPVTFCCLWATNGSEEVFAVSRRNRGSHPDPNRLFVGYGSQRRKHIAIPISPEKPKNYSWGCHIDCHFQLLASTKNEDLLRKSASITKEIGIGKQSAVAHPDRLGCVT